MLRKRLALVALLSGCTVGDYYVVPSPTLEAVRSMPPDQRAHTAAEVMRNKGGEAVAVRASSFALGEAKPRPDGRWVVPTRTKSRRLQIANALVWTGTPPSIAGLLMIILGHGAVRWSGIALAAAAEPVMITGTVMWVKGSYARPQEVPLGQADLRYLP